ncbi:MAG TPA: hypothetical protein VG754_03125 [Verrucomicrobiae bacterium]|nr:hypothetical protein [Verrucomicrobiae bacterium]
MNFKFPDENRTFREFFPDPKLRHTMHYNFAHRFLPQYIHRNPYAFFSYIFRRDAPGLPMEPNRFLHSRWMAFEENIKGTMWQNVNSFRRVTDMTMSLHEAAGRPVALVQMPNPEQPAEAFFVAATLLASPAPEGWSRDVLARVFTLEALSPLFPESRTHGMFCEWLKNGRHANYGIGYTPEHGAFLQGVTVALQVELPESASFTPSEAGGLGAISANIPVRPPTKS